MVPSQNLPGQAITIKDLSNKSVLARIQDVHLLGTFRSIGTLGQIAWCALYCLEHNQYHFFSYMWGCICMWILHSIQRTKDGMVRCDTWEVRSNYLFAPGNSTAMSSERFAFLHNQNDKKHSQLSLFIICRHMSSTNSSQYHCTFSLNTLKSSEFPSNVQYSEMYTVLNYKQ